MNYLSRMWASITHYKRKSILLLLVSSILSTILIVSFSIRASSDAYIKHIRTSIDSSISIMTEDTYNLDATLVNKISLKELDEIKNCENVKAVHSYIRQLAYAKDFTPIITQEQQEVESRKKKIASTEKKEKSNYVPPFNIYVQGNEESKYNDDFIEQSVSLMAGRLIEAGDEHVCLIHYKLAEANKLAINSKITLNIPMTEENPQEKNVTLKVIGIFSGENDEDSDLYDPYYNVENHIYTDTTSALEFSDLKAVARVECDMRDPELNTDFVQQVVEKNSPDSDKYIFDYNDTTYRLLRNSLRVILNVTNLVLFAVILLGIIIVTFMSAMSMRDRDFEIGVLLSMGEQKKKIILQMVGEVLVPVLAGGILGIGISICLNNMVNHLIGQAIAIKVTLSLAPILWMFVGAIGLNAIGALMTIYKVIRYRPKQVLMHVE